MTDMQKIEMDKKARTFLSNLKKSGKYEFFPAIRHYKDGGAVVEVRYRMAGKKNVMSVFFPLYSRATTRKAAC